ncbi:Uncharacterised protein [Fusobacterium varium]|nr:Uncharacterised protein [Fusobacterium varium]
MIRLTEKELKNVKENKDAIAQLLVKKAILNEIKEKNIMMKKKNLWKN